MKFQLYEVGMPSLDDYVLKVSRQMQIFEVELEECDKILQESEIGDWILLDYRSVMIGELYKVLLI